MNIKYDEFSETLSSPIPAEVYAAVAFVGSVCPPGFAVYSISRTVVKGWGHDVEVVLHWPDMEEDYVHVTTSISFLKMADGRVEVEEITVVVDGEFEVEGFIQATERSAELDLKSGILTWIGTATQVKNLVEEAKTNVKAN